VEEFGVEGLVEPVLLVELDVPVVVLQHLIALYEKQPQLNFSVPVLEHQYLHDL